MNSETKKWPAFFCLWKKKYPQQFSTQIIQLQIWITFFVYDIFSFFFLHSLLLNEIFPTKETAFKSYVTLTHNKQEKSEKIIKNSLLTRFYHMKTSAHVKINLPIRFSTLNCIYGPNLNEIGEKIRKNKINM